MLSRSSRNFANGLRPKACPPYVLLGVHSFICCGSSVVCGTYTPAHQSRVDSRAIGSLLFGSAKSSWNESQRLVQAPAEPPAAAIRALSIFHSAALLRTNCNARAASYSGAFTGG